MINYIFWTKQRGKYCNNFGDLLTPYFYKKIYNKTPIRRERGAKNIVFGAGSNLNSIDENAIIWGSGYRAPVRKIVKPKKILSVRGPLTRELFLKQNINCPAVYGDPGLILPKFYNPKIEKKYKVGIIPHCVDYFECKEMFKNIKDVNVIKIFGPEKDNIEDVVDEILECEYTISSSLHGVIASHAYGIKSAYTRIGKTFPAGGWFKFQDYYESVGINRKRIRHYGPLKKSYSANELIDIINNYPNPQFPLKMDHILDICPFKT